jgi:hypothetical protein
VQTYPDLVRTLPEKLPNEQARHAYNERLEAILQNPRAKQFGEEELARFFDWSHFLEASAVDRWVTLSSANPAMAARNARIALDAADEDQRRLISDGARRGLVRGLVRAAAYPSAFHDAALALAQLAVAENEAWANNASGEFVARFQLFLSGTACPYLDRLEVIDELVSRGKPAPLRLAIRALTRAGDGSAFGMADSSSARPLPQTWQPKTQSERIECARTAFGRLSRRRCD